MRTFFDQGHFALSRFCVRVLIQIILALLATATTFPTLVRAEAQNDAVGFSTNHVFESSSAGEHIDVLSGNLTLTIPIGPRYKLNDYFDYGVTLYYNAKIWEHECPPSDNHTPCPGVVLPNDAYGLGFSLLPGRIYHHSGDKGYVFRLQLEDGSEHFFCNPSADLTSYNTDQSAYPIGQPLCDGYVWDSSHVHVLPWTTPDGHPGWTADFPGGRRMYFGRVLDDTLREAVVTRVEGPQGAVWVDYNYRPLPAKYALDNITDSNNRITQFKYNLSAPHGPNDIEIDVPAFNGHSTFDGTTVAKYFLVRQSHTFSDPSVGSAGTPTKYFLEEIEYPPAIPGAASSATYDFEYSRSAETTYGYMLQRTIPTGAVTNYYYDFYATSPLHPMHQELTRKVVTSGGTDYEWTWDRPVVAVNTGNTTLAGSNPYEVRTVDPFHNLTVYEFLSTIYDGATDCNHLSECINNWSDGLLASESLYAGPEPDASRLVSRTESNWDSDLDALGHKMLQYHIPRTDTSGVFGLRTVESVGVNVRKIESKATTPSHGVSAGHTLTTKQGDWFQLCPQQVDEYVDDALYRSTYRKEGGVDCRTPRYIEVKDASGNVVSRTDRLYLGSLLLCEVRRKGTNHDDQLTSCDDLSLELGDVATTYQFETTGNWGTVEVKAIGGDVSTSDVRTTHLGYTQGNGRDTGYVSSRDVALGWKSVDRDVDFNTGLTYLSRDPGGSTTRYTWDDLGRLKSIEPALPERPTNITYPTLSETHVKQDRLDGSFTETIYLYDDLGRMIETQRRTATGSLDMERSEYDIASRMLRKSEWAPLGTPSNELKWTTFDYTQFTDPDPQPGAISRFPDPLGRIHALTTPDDPTPATPTVETTFDGDTTTVTTRDVRGWSAGTDTNLTTTTSRTTDGLGRLVSVDSPGPGADAQYFYDENNDLTEVRLTDPADVTHVQLRRFDYDRLGRLRVAYNPESGTTEYISYDARGNLLSYKDARQNTFNLAYDAADRLLTRKLGTLLLVQNVYDSESGLSSGASAGRLVHQNSFKSAGGISQFVSSVQYGFGASDSSTPCTAGSGYTGLNGRLSWTRTQVMPWSTSVQVDYCQDVLGVDSTIGYPYVYGSGRTRTKLASTFWNGYLGELHDEGHNLQYAKTISYASGGVPREIRRGDNERDVTYLDIRNRPIGFEAFGLQTSYGDPVPCDPPPGGGEGQVMVPWEWCGDPPISSEEVLNWYSGGYTYDMAGNVKSIGAEQYYYDSVSRLVHASMPVGGSTHILDFTYDGFGNMTKQSRSTSGSSQYSGERQYAIDPLTNRLFSTTWTNGIGSPIDYTFDDNGNMTADGSRGLVFDAENRLREVMDPERGRIGNYDYDASGFRVRSEVDGAEIFYFRDASGQVLSEFQRPLGTGGDPVWNKDYVYLFGKSFALVKNDVPTTPKLPWITPISSTSLTLNWAPTGDQDILGYSIERTYKKCSTCTATTGTISVPASPLHWTDSFLNPSSTGTSALLKYVVRAMDTAGNLSDPSPMITVYPGPSLNPPAPPSIIVTPGDRAVTITWAATAPLHTDLQGYYVERNSSAHPAWERLNDYALTTREYVDTLLANGTQYCYRVYAVDNCNRPGSPTSSACTSPIDNAAPGKLTGVTAEADRLPGTIRVRWGRGLDSDIATYRVYRSSDPSSIGTQFQDVSGQGQGMVFEATDTDLTRGDYCYRVSALDLTHESSPSEPACARPRYSGPPAPVSLSATYNVDPNGTPSPEFCNVSAESDDIIQVLVDWSLSPSQALNGSHFHIYRKSANDTLYTMLGTVDYDGRSTPYEFKDKAITEGSYSYFVATYEFVAPSWEESAGSLEVSMAHAFPSSATVRDVRVTDSRDYYSTGNKESRWTIVSWSRVPEPDLVGYNVYRMCNFAGCTEHAGSATRTDVASCEPVWVRLNMIPVLPTNRVYEDSDVGGLGGCFLYAVRPVGPDQVEGPITRVVEADLTPGQVAAVAPVHCSAPLTIGDDSLPMPVGHNLPNPPYWFYPTVNSISVDTLLNGPNGVNLQAHTGTPGATPPAPTGVHLSLDLKPAWVSPELADVTIARISWSMPSAPINLLGFHVEAARSSSGPWVRLTRSPVAWWERHYTAQGLGAIPSCNASQPNCWQFRVLSVDTDSAESSATAAAENPSCSAPPPAPQNLHAVTIGSGLNVRAQLTWDPSLGASSYVIYRMVIVGGSGGNPYFYRTQIQAGTTFEEWGDPAQDPYPAPWVCPNMNCPYLLPEGCSRNYLDVYYVTALGSTGTESLRSNLVFWKAGGPSDGYDDARLSPPSWALPATDAQDELLACMQPAPPVNDRASTGGDNSYTPAQPSREPHTLQPSPMVRLGSIADPPWSVLNLHTDHLGTVRLVTSNATTLPVSRHDYFPFGEEIAPQTSYNTHQYTGHERDRESGLDYMLARYYGDSLPRFLSADPASGSPHDPQSWNRFAYVRNNPLVLIDPTGMYWAPGTPMPILPGDPNGCTMCILVVDPLAPADWQSRAMAQLSVLKQSNPRIAAMIKQLEDSDNVHTLTPSSGGGSLTKALDEEASYNGTGSGSTIYFNVDQFDSDDTPSYPFAVLAHELSHAEDIDRGRMDRVDSTNRHRVSEEKAVRMENLANQSVGSGLSPKTFYQGDWYYVPQIRVAFPTSVPPQW